MRRGLGVVVVVIAVAASSCAYGSGDSAESFVATASPETSNPPITADLTEEQRILDEQAGIEDEAQRLKDLEVTEQRERTESLTLEHIGRSRAVSLAELEGFTAIWTKEGPGSIRVRDKSGRLLRATAMEVTVLADGRSWTDYADGGWYSFDPSAGLSRSMTVGGLGGVRTYQEFNFSPDLATGAGPIIGGGPTGPLHIEEQNNDITIEESSYVGRPAWTIIARGHSDDFTIETEETFLIDIGTGLIVESTRRKTIIGDHEDYDQYSLIDLEVVDTMPPEFPGQFPEDAAVEHRDLSGGFQIVTLDEAIDGFGPDLVVPSESSESRTISIYDYTLEHPSTANPTRQEVRVTSQDGFAITTTRVWRIVPSPITIMVNGQLCYGVDEAVGCDRFGSTETITKGALAGRYVTTERGTITVYGEGIVIEISSVSTEAALQLAETFIAR